METRAMMRKDNLLTMLCLSYFARHLYRFSRGSLISFWDMLGFGILMTGLAFGNTVWGAPDNEDSSLPEPAVFLEQVRKHAITDQLLLSQYTFIETRTRISKGEPDEVTTEVRQIYPAANPGDTYRRLLSVNGEPLSEKDVAKQVRKRRNQLAKRARELAGETITERGQRLKEAAQAQSEEKELFEEMLTLFDFQLLRRENLDGHSTIAVSFMPRPDAKPRTRRGTMFSKSRGLLWVSEEDYKVVRVEAETLEDVKIGWGLIAIMHKGLSFTLNYRKVNDEIWLPSHLRMLGSGRKFLFKSFRFERRTEYSDFKKLTEDKMVDALLQ